MANLRVDKITSTETFETTGSVQFGNDNALKIAANSGFDLTSNDFTMESWIYMNSVESFQTILMYTVDGTEDDTSFQFDITSTQLRFVAYVSNSSEVYGSNFSFGAGTWYHVAATRTNGLVRLFVDGDLIGTHLFTSTIDTEASAELNIGYRNNNGTMDREVFGHLTNIRIINGKALYTANFKPPMRELEVTPETTLLCCQSKTDASHEKTGKTITVLGNAVASELTPGILTPVPKAGAGGAITGSVEFDGTDDYLQLDNDEDFQFGTGDWSIEFWWNGQPTGSYTSVITTLVSSNEAGTWRVGTRFNSTNKIYFARGTGSSFTDVQFDVDVNDGYWHHIAFVRSSGTIIPFVDGVDRTADLSNGSVSDSNSMTTTNPVKIGYNSRDDAYINGFISNLRVVKGTALYTDSFIPPTRELKKVPGTVLLCCQDPDSPLTEATGKTITGYGNLNQSYGAELVTNGQFTADSNWTKGTQWTIVGGAASITDSPDRGSDSLLTQDASSWIQEGQMYRVGVDWSFSNGDFDIRLGGDSTYTEYSIESSQSSPYFFNIEAGGTNNNLAIIANQHAVGDINSISVEKLPPSRTGSNFTPQVGDDRKVTFEGVTKVNTENYFYLPTGDTASREATGTYNAGTRGLMAGGFPSTDVIQYVTIASTGDAIDFGNLAAGNYGLGACASRTRGLFLGGQDPAVSNRIQYVTIESTGNITDFGDLTVARRYLAACSNSTRGVAFGGGIGPGAPQAKDEIDYVTIASTGDATDFGDLTGAYYAPSGCSSSVRGLSFGGRAGTSDYYNVINYITISSTGNAKDFGDLVTKNAFSAAASNSTRGLAFGGLNNPTNVNTIQFVTIASMGNAQDFGDLPAGRRGKAASASATRAISSGGYDGSDYTNAIEFVTIPTTGNAIDFGNLTNSIESHASCSSGHGGLG